MNARYIILLFSLLIGLQQATSQTVLRARIKQNEKWGVIDDKGKFIVKPKYEHISEYSEGLAEVRIAGKSGYIDQNGKLVISAAFNHAGLFNNGLAPVASGDSSYYIDRKGKRTLPGKYEDADIFSSGLAAVKQNGKWGYINGNGKTAIPFAYDNATSFTGEYAVVTINSKKGVINKQGTTVIPAAYDRILPCNKELFVVSKGALSGYVNSKNQIVIPVQYDELGLFDLAWPNELSPGIYKTAIEYKLKDKTGYLDRKGENVNLPYTSIDYFSEGLAAVKTGNTWGYVDTTDTTKIAPQFTEAIRFSEGLAAVKTKENKWGFIDHQGNWQIQPALVSNTAPFFHHGLALLDDGNKSTIIDKKGKAIASYTNSTVYYYQSVKPTP